MVVINKKNGLERFKGTILLSGYKFNFIEIYEIPIGKMHSKKSTNTYLQWINILSLLGQETITEQKKQHIWRNA